MRICMYPLGNDATLADLVTSVQTNLTMLNKHMSKANNDKPVGPMQPGPPAMRAYGGGGMVAAMGGLFGGALPPWMFGGGIYPGHPGNSSSSHTTPHRRYTIAYTPSPYLVHALSHPLSNPLSHPLVHLLSHTPSHRLVTSNTHRLSWRGLSRWIPWWRRWQGKGSHNAPL